MAAEPGRAGAMAEVAERLKSKGDLVLTNHGKPVAMLVPVSECGEIQELRRPCTVRFPRPAQRG